MRDAYAARRVHPGLAAALLAALWSAPQALGAVGASGPEGSAQEGRRVILVTGSTGGLGREVALDLGEAGDHVLVHGRNVERGHAVVRAIEEAGGTAQFYRADLGSFDEVRRLAREVRRDHDRLDVLVNNAGIALPGDERRLSEDGHELHFQVNYLSGYLLTKLLLPLLREGAPSRVVNVSSLAAAPIDFENVMLATDYSLGRAYGQSKLAQVMFTFDLAAELERSGIVVNALHPSTFMNTDMVEELGVPPRTSVQEGVAAVLQLVNDDVGSGRFFDVLEPSEPHEQAYD